MNFYIDKDKIYVDLWERNVWISEALIEASDNIKHNEKQGLITMRVNNGQATYRVVGHSVLTSAYQCNLVQCTFVARPLPPPTSPITTPVEKEQSFEDVE